MTTTKELKNVRKRGLLLENFKWFFKFHDFEIFHYINRHLPELYGPRLYYEENIYRPKE